MSFFLDSSSFFGVIAKRITTRIARSRRQPLAEIVTEDNQLPRQPEHQNVSKPFSIRASYSKRKKAGLKCNKT